MPTAHIWDKIKFPNFLVKMKNVFFVCSKDSAKYCKVIKIEDIGHARRVTSSQKIMENLKGSWKSWKNSSFFRNLGQFAKIPGKISISKVCIFIINKLIKFWVLFQEEQSSVFCKLFTLFPLQGLVQSLYISMYLLPKAQYAQINNKKLNLHVIGNVGLLELPSFDLKFN